jgi:hypothetical protein
VQSALVGTGHQLPRLPHGASFTISVRRAVRSGDADGVLIEDNGIAGQPYAMTERDVLQGNTDLLAHCGELLASQPVTAMRADAVGTSVVVRTEGLDRVDVYADGCPQRSIRIGRSKKVVVRLPTAGTIELLGYSGAALKQRRRIVLST